LTLSHPSDILAPQFEVGLKRSGNRGKGSALAAVVVIPARFGSTRFPAKILAAETGRPLVQHVVDRVRHCRNVDDIIVATDNKRISDALQPFGTHCVLTDPKHPSGTDRVAEVARDLKYDTVINVQGDEPEIDPATIDALAEQMTDPDAEMWTAATNWPWPTDPADANLVKVVLRKDGKAMYFSRSPIPFYRDAASDAQPTYYLHVGVYAYRRDTLLRLAALKPTPCEQAEKLEQLRALENGIDIGVKLIDRATHGIDTAEQYAQFVGRFKKAELK
jgi:3-deoxy-manno-octulosonate cytidylyltransferase (CMP-KDO synthetase)